MNKLEAKKIVEDLVNPLIEKLKVAKEGFPCFMEYTTNWWNQDSIRKICEKVFNETYKICQKNKKKQKNKII